MNINRPVRFAGTPEQAAANRATHNFDITDDARCFNCDCRPSHAAAAYPCGASVPREVVQVGGGGEWTQNDLADDRAPDGAARWHDGNDTDERVQVGGGL